MDEEVKTFDPKEIDPNMDVSEMPVGTHILSKGKRYILTEEKQLKEDK